MFSFFLKSSHLCLKSFQCFLKSLHLFLERFQFFLKKFNFSQNIPLVSQKKSQKISNFLQKKLG